MGAKRHQSFVRLLAVVFVDLVVARNLVRNDGLSDHGLSEVPQSSGPAAVLVQEMGPSTVPMPRSNRKLRAEMAHAAHAPKGDSILSGSSPLVQGQGYAVGTTGDRHHRQVLSTNSTAINEAVRYPRVTFLSQNVVTTAQSEATSNDRNTGTSKKRTSSGVTNGTKGGATASPEAAFGNLVNKTGAAGPGPQQPGPSLAGQALITGKPAAGQVQATSSGARGLNASTETLSFPDLIPQTEAHLTGKYHVNTGPPEGDKGISANVCQEVCRRYPEAYFGSYACGCDRATNSVAYGKVCGCLPLG